MNTKQFFSFLSVGLFLSTIALADNDPILMTIGTEAIKKSEFLSIYQKNNNNKTDLFKEESLNEYMDLFVKFKLKVIEAKEWQLDTNKSFISELSGYRKQLAQPYLTDKSVTEKLVQEAYERMKYDVRASHILIKVSEMDTPKDTLVAYKKAMDIRDKILKGMPFREAAMQFSDDLSAKDQPKTEKNPAMKGNGGDLGYFTVFDMIYPFEVAAYAQSIGDISLPIRTRYGYHLIQVTDKLPAMGKAKIAHILLAEGSKSPEELKNQITQIAQEIKNGKSFEEAAATYSDDKASGEKGGVLPWFGTNRMVPEFIQQIAKLSPNQLSEPFLTAYGWHIIKLLEKKNIGSFAEESHELKAKVAKNSRNDLSKTIMTSRLKKEYGFTENKKAKEDFYAIINDDFLKNWWKMESCQHLQKELFKIGNKAYSQQDFAFYLEKNQGPNKVAETTNKLVDYHYTNFVENACISYEDARLEEKYPEFKALMKEYKEGLLLFELTDKKVWSKAIQDTAGLHAFYEKNKTNYMWDTRVKASIYTCKEASILKKVSKMALKNSTKGENDKAILDKINASSADNVSIETKVFSKKDNEIIDQMTWEKGANTTFEKDGKQVYILIQEVLKPEPKKLTEAKGIITSDYQTYLETEWINQLKAKYPVQIQQEVFNALIVK